MSTEMWDTGTEAWSMGVETNPIVVRLDTSVVASKEERTMMEEYWKRQTEMHCGYHAYSAALAATRARAVARATSVLLRGVGRGLLLSGVQDSMRARACHFSHTCFFQSKHRASLIKGW